MPLSYTFIIITLTKFAYFSKIYHTLYQDHILIGMVHIKLSLNVLIHLKI